MSENGETEIRHRKLDPNEEEPAVEIAEIVAALEGTSPENLESTWKQIDHILTHIFENPPEPEAQIEVTFSYEGYRITVEQDGSAKFVPIE